MTPLLAARSLEVWAGPRRVVGPASLALAAGQAHVLLGESGSGKTLLLRALVGLEPPSLAVRGEVLREGAPVPLTARRESLGRCAAYLPQEAAPALNPVRRLGAQLAEVLAPGLAVDVLLARAGLREPGLVHRFPHELSGGQAQRALLALALAAGPRLLIADEPTTALDPSHRAALLTTFAQLVADGVGVVFVTHDLEAARALGVGGRCSVLFAGGVVEEGEGAALLSRPRHPYTRRLLAVKLELDRPAAPPEAKDALPPAEKGCVYAPRCPHARPQCLAESPGLVEGVACFFPEAA